MLVFTTTLFSLSLCSPKLLYSHCYVTKPNRSQHNTDGCGRSGRFDRVEVVNKVVKEDVNEDVKEEVHEDVNERSC